jgi:hypothetical protein
LRFLLLLEAYYISFNANELLIAQSPLGIKTILLRPFFLQNIIPQKYSTQPGQQEHHNYKKRADHL